MSWAWRSYPARPVKKRGIGVEYSDFEYIADFLLNNAGIVLTKDKGYLLDSRLLPLAREKGFEGISGIVKALRDGSDKDLAYAVTEAMTTNETLFFRNENTFNIFKSAVLPEFLKRRGQDKSLRIWCAAASSGQEPYSLAMMLKEMEAELAGWKIDILGTDISKKVLNRARSGEYSQFEVQRGLPVQMLVKYFTKQGNLWVISPDLRKMVRFKEHNLLDRFEGLGKFDFVFCCNVLIYFNKETKGEILKRVREGMADDGVLFLGGSETIMGITDQFDLVPGRSGAYAAASKKGPAEKRIAS
jgi:chemotaxis protein methyltransferase CheR